VYGIVTRAILPAAAFPRGVHRLKACSAAKTADVASLATGSTSGGYLTAMVRPGWLCTPPKVTTTGSAAPASTPVGTVTFN
jgi:hypothetical protein